MSSNVLKRRLADGEVLVGHLLAYASPWLVEILGATGYDFVVIDLEHEPINDESVLELVRAADAAGISTIARMPLSSRLDPVLSAGVHGIQIPDIADAAAARDIVEATRFAPLGRRTYYTQTRAANYGVDIDERAWVAQANEELLVIGMIEDVRAVGQLDAILGVEGIDAIHVGQLDLAQSMGYPSTGRDRAGDGRGRRAEPRRGQIRRGRRRRCVEHRWNWRANRERRAAASNLSLDGHARFQRLPVSDRGADTDRPAHALRESRLAQPVHLARLR